MFFFLREPDFGWKGSSNRVPWFPLFPSMTFIPTTITLPPFGPICLNFNFLVARFPYLQGCSPAYNLLFYIAHSFIHYWGKSTQNPSTEFEVLINPAQPGKKFQCRRVFGATKAWGGASRSLARVSPLSEPPTLLLQTAPTVMAEGVKKDLRWFSEHYNTSLHAVVGTGWVDVWAQSGLG